MWKIDGVLYSNLQEYCDDAEPMSYLKTLPDLKIGDYIQVLEDIYIECDMGVYGVVTEFDDHDVEYTIIAGNNCGKTVSIRMCQSAECPVTKISEDELRECLEEIWEGNC